MDRFPRFVIGFIVSVLIFVALVNFAHIPVESYAPPPTLYKFCTATGQGTVTKLQEKTLVDHILEGTDTWYYVYYTFSAIPVSATEATAATSGASVVRKRSKKHNPTTELPAGVPQTYTGSVRVEEQTYESVKAGDSVNVSYDPVSPRINGVPGTMGQWSTTTGFLNPYLWWYIGIIALTFLLQELIRVFTRTNDLR